MERGLLFLFWSPSRKSSKVRFDKASFFGANNHMGLITCQDCGSEFSERAMACPKCGGPNDLVTSQMGQPAPAVPASKPATPQKKLFGRLVVVRRKHFYAMLLSIRVLVDRVLVGNVKNGGRLVVDDLPVGQHEITFTHPLRRLGGKDFTEIGRQGAGGAPFEIHPGKTTSIEFKNGVTGLAILSKRVY